MTKSKQQSLQNQPRPLSPEHKILNGVIAWPDERQALEKKLDDLIRDDWQIVGISTSETIYSAQRMTVLLQRFRRKNMKELGW